MQCIAVPTDLTITQFQQECELPSTWVVEHPNTLLSTVRKKLLSCAQPENEHGAFSLSPQGLQVENRSRFDEDSLKCFGTSAPGVIEVETT